MLDSDLANLYHAETKRINEAVKNNPNKFPERFCWKLNNYESKCLLAENVDQKIETHGGHWYYGAPAGVFAFSGDNGSGVGGAVSFRSVLR